MPMRWQQMSFSLVFLCGMLASAQSQRVVRISSPDAINPGEVSVAINPKNPDNMIVVSQQLGKRNGPWAGHGYDWRRYVTSDGGHTWRTAEASNPRGGDDSVAFSSDGIAHHVYISFDGILGSRPKQPYSAVFVSTSRDGGVSWEDSVPIIEHINSVSPFEDKPYVVTDNVAASPYKNSVYVAWTRFDDYGSADPQCRSHIYFSRSSDSGRNFSAPIRISKEPGDCADSSNTVEGAFVATGVHGEIYVIWSGPTGLVFIQSLDGGSTFSRERVITKTPGGWDVKVRGLKRGNGMPVAKVDYSNGPQRGAIYVNWLDQRGGDLAVFVMSSRDGGETWSPPVRVKDDQPGNRMAQFHTWMAVDPMDGAVNIIFYEQPDREGSKANVILARSVDGARTFVNHRIDLEPFEFNPKIFIGDYNGIDAYGGLVVAAFEHFLSDRESAISVAITRFEPGTQQIERNR